MKKFKISFTFILLLSILLMISSFSWISIWIGLEINLLAMVTLMYMNKIPSTSEASIKYFIIQAIASLVFLMSIIMELINITLIDYTLMMAMMMLLKMSVAPLHFWLPEIVEGSTWSIGGILMTLQKMGPMIILSYMSINLNLITYFTLLSILIGGIQGLNQTSLKKILAFSSISHSGWMIMSLQFSMSTWLIYFISYSLSALSMLALFMNTKVYQINDLLIYCQNPLIFILIISQFFMVSGLPPFLMFFPKWMVMQLLLQLNFFLTPFLMVIFSLITIYMYIQVVSSLLMLSYSVPKLYWKNELTLSACLSTIMPFALAVVIMFPFF